MELSYKNSPEDEIDRLEEGITKILYMSAPLLGDLRPAINKDKIRYLLKKLLNGEEI